MDTTEKNPKIYELGYLVVPTVAEENVAKEVEAIKAILASANAAIITEDSPKLRPLSYSMLKVIGSNRSKFDKAYFGWIKFEVSPSSIVPMKSQLEKIDSILRMMVIETVRENTMIMRKSASREDAPASAEAAPAPKMTEAELDKTIDSLVATS